MQANDILKMLGPKQATLLGIQLGLVALLGAISYLYLVPQTQQQVMRLEHARGIVNSKKNEIQMLRQQYADLQGFMRRYRILENRKFFADQDRIQARRLLDRIIGQNGMIRAKYEIKQATFARMEDRNAPPMPAPPPPDPNAPEGTPAPAVPKDYVLIVSPIEISFEAYDDVQVYKFLKSLQDLYPGMVAITSLDMQKVQEFNADAYLQIGNGTPLPLVKGNVDLNWYSMVSRDKVNINAAAQGE